MIVKTEYIGRLVDISVGLVQILYTKGGYKDDIKGSILMLQYMFRNHERYIVKGILRVGKSRFFKYFKGKHSFLERGYNMTSV
jgi:hypothetical protein